MKMTEKEIETFVRAFLEEYTTTPYGVVGRLAVRLSMDKADIQQTIVNLRSRKIKLPLLPKGGKGDQLNVDKINAMIDQRLNRKVPTTDPRDRLSNGEYGYEG